MVTADQLAEVVDRFSEQRCNAQIMRSCSPILSSQLPIDVHASEVQQRVLVIRSIVRLHFEIVSGHSIVSSIDEGFDRILIC